ncbi:MAG: 2-hydroxyacyl-CoA dehydratase family protein [Clostridiales Family XIII bacterium]|jgi:bcr-type benzoyl-CoA reductase subunit C|nr:2-hydroxyacyl-CoA dehydratase family protein [Clostridiales Family XIII bacterium]
MMSYDEAVAYLIDTARHPRRAVERTLKDTGKEAIGCFPVYTPEEIIYAAGFVPVGVWGGRTELQLADKYLPRFCCSIMRSNIEYGMNGTYNALKGMVIPAFCDTLKCMIENWKTAVPQVPAIPVVYAQNRLLEPGIEYMENEFGRVRDVLGELRGKPISDAALEEAFSVYEDYRSEMRTFTKLACDRTNSISASVRHLIIKAAYFMDKVAYTNVIREINAGLSAKEPEKSKGIRVIVTGYQAEPIELLDIFDESDIAIAGDDLAQESRQFRTPARPEGTALERMAYRVADQRGDTFFYEKAKTKGEMLVEMAKELRADGVVVCMMKFCDPEEFDYPVIKTTIEDAGFPLLYFETEQQMETFEQTRTRIQGFAEMLL